ncbi:MAG TPA: hypothetical protein VNV62_00450, partial [Trebonia sp.]|nr:hypothetical protein [Trebonia sp.]
MDASELGWIWTVYRVSSYEMIANGHSGNQYRARTMVATALEQEPDHSAWGVVIGPGGQHEIGRRDAPRSISWQS